MSKDITKRSIVKFRNVWNNDQQTFVEMTLYRRKGTLNEDQMTWLQKTFGNEGVYKNGQYWDYSQSGNFIVMDERVYTWYSMKWGSK